MKRVLLPPLIETYTSVNVSLKTLLVLTHRRTAHEQQCVGGRLGNHNVDLYRCFGVHERQTGPSAIDFVVPAHLSLHSGTSPPEISPVGSFREFRLLGRTAACCCDQIQSP